MKRFLALFLALLMPLCACARENTSPSDPSASTAVDESEPARPDFGLYEAGSAVEVQTGGAVKYFPLENVDHYAVEPMGDGLLLFRGDSETTLTLLREETDPVVVSLGCFVYPDDSTLRITERGVFYFDDLNDEIVHLGTELQETTRVKLPGDAKSPPTLSADGKLAYYYSGDSLRCFDMSTGISRLLKVSSFQAQECWGLHFDGTVLECIVTDSERSFCQFISTATGQLLAEYDVFPDIETEGDIYFAEYYDGRYFQNLFGTREEKPQCLQPAQTYITVQPLLALGRCLAYEGDESGTTLYDYDLEHGTCSSQVRLDGVESPWYVAGDAGSGLIWSLAFDTARTAQALYCWDPSLSLTADETSYVTPYYTALEPDAEGLAAIADQAKALGDQYGVRIYTWEDAQSAVPDDYTFELEYQVATYESSLAVLEEALSAFPAGFFKTMGKGSKNGVVTISLVRGIYGDNDLGSLTMADGVHFWNDGSGYVALTMGDNMEQTFYHELFHAIDSYVLSETSAYDNWNKLNPADFEYDYDYIANQFREDDQYLEDATRSFIDIYSMSYPKEDRARVMEYAMMEGNEAYFQSDTMQAKLKMLCKGIRSAFGLKKYTEPLIWEQYLKEPLV